MSYDLLGQSKVKRLIYRGGKWQLEISRLVGKSGIYHQELDYLKSPKLILGYLEEHVSSELAADAKSLLATPPEKEASYEAASGIWVQHGNLTDAPPRSGSKGAHGGPQLLELQAELGRVKAVCAELRLHLNQLQSEVARLRSGARPVTGHYEQAVPMSVPTEAGAARPKVASKPSTGPASVAPDASVATEASSKATLPEETPTTAELPTFKPLRLPTSEKLLKCMSLLFDQPLACKPIKKAPNVTTNPSDWYASILVDDQDTEIGAVVCSFEGTVRLGARLMMFGEGQVNEQLKSGQVDDSTLEATSEIFNTVSSTFNEIQSNAHCRTRPLERLVDLDVSWLSQSRTQLALNLDLGGILLCLGR